MIIIKKKNVLQELAVCLFLTLEFNPDITAASLIKRIQERSKAALNAASTYTGVLGKQEVKGFLDVKPLHFNIDCGKDIVIGDTIRFKEQVYNNKLCPPRQLGLRGVVAEVIGITAKRDNPLFHLRVISSGGVWDLKPDMQIKRTLKIITRMEVMRAQWEHESQREKTGSAADQTPKHIVVAKAQILARRDRPKGQ